MKRKNRYENFDHFANTAETTFDTLLASDGRAKEFSNAYSFYAVKGGAMGATDKRIVEVFFGTRMIDRVDTFESQAGFPRRQNKLLPEKGACLRYERTDTGTVICTLFPAGTESSRQREDSILLAWLADPRALHSNFTVTRHWRSLISYMQCTSVDGEPTAFDKIRVGYLRFTRRLIIDGCAQTTRFKTMLERAFGYALTIGLSGFLLTLINMFGDSKDTERLKNEHVSLTRELSEARGVITAQSERIAALEQRMDVIRPGAVNSSRAVVRTLRNKAAPRY